jgi:hypothetical protein
MPADKRHNMNTIQESNTFELREKKEGPTRRHLMRTLLIAILISAFATPAGANYVGKRLRSKLATQISAATLAAPRSFEYEHELPNESWGLALLWVTVTDANNSETGVSIACTASEGLRQRNSYSGWILRGSRISSAPSRLQVVLPRIQSP